MIWNSVIHSADFFFDPQWHNAFKHEPSFLREPIRSIAHNLLETGQIGLRNVRTTSHHQEIPGICQFCSVTGEE